MSDKPRYYVVRKGRAFFELGRDRAAKAGMSASIPLGLDGPRAKAAAHIYYAEWIESQGRNRPQSAASETPKSLYPPGALGAWFEAYRKSEAWKRKAPATRVEWEALWKYIGPALGSRPLREIHPAEFEAFQIRIEAEKGPIVRWRAVKIARALFECWRLRAQSQRSRWRKAPSSASGACCMTESGSLA